MFSYFNKSYVDAVLGVFFPKHSVKAIQKGQLGYSIMESKRTFFSGIGAI